jgi:signal transduction histidine kinase
MLYWAVGSRELDGGLMCTASHNPKAYTGAKLVKRGALALSGDSGIGELREIVVAGEPGEPAAETGTVEHEDIADAFREAALGYIDASAIKPLKVVVDGGSGISEEYLHRVFDPFWSSKPGGMGMGLAICQSIVAAHRGSMTVSNNADHGAAFRVTLPTRHRGSP